jgi:hypothetical protein
LLQRATDAVLRSAFRQGHQAVIECCGLANPVQVGIESWITARIGLFADILLRVVLFKFWSLSTRSEGLEVSVVRYEMVRR